MILLKRLSALVRRNNHVKMESLIQVEQEKIESMIQKAETKGRLPLRSSPIFSTSVVAKMGPTESEGLDHELSLQANVELTNSKEVTASPAAPSATAAGADKDTTTSPTVIGKTNHFEITWCYCPCRPHGGHFQSTSLCQC